MRSGALSPRSTFACAFTMSQAGANAPPGSDASVGMTESHYRHDHGCLKVAGRQRHAEVDSTTAVDDPIDVGRFQEVSEHHLGAGRSQGRCPVVLTTVHGANRKAAVKEEFGDGSADRPQATGCSCHED